MLGEISFVAGQQRLDIVVDEVDFATDRLGLARQESAHAKIRMETDDDSLKQLLVGLPSGRQDHFFVGGKTTDQSIVRCLRVQRPRIDVLSINGLRSPHLAGDIAGVRRPDFGGHSLEMSANKDERFSDIGLLVPARKISHSNTRLRPMSLRSLIGRISRDQTKINLVSGRGDRMVNGHTVGESALQLDTVVGLGHKLRGMPDRRFVPLSSRRARSAVRLEVPNAYALARQPIALNHARGPAGPFGGRSAADACAVINAATITTRTCLHARSCFTATSESCRFMVNRLRGE